jgi:hypothetical protein
MSAIIVMDTRRQSQKNNTGTKRNYKSESLKYRKKSIVKIVFSEMLIFVTCEHVILISSKTLEKIIYSLSLYAG